MEYRPIAAWLKKNRLAQLDPATRQPWTQKHLVEVFRAETDWPMYASNYSKYESGVSTPEPTTLDRFIAFWAKHGIEGPDLTPPPAPAEATETPADLAAAMWAQVEELREQNAIGREQLAATRDQSAMLERVLTLLISGVTGGSAAQEWAQAEIAKLPQAATPSQGPTPDDPGRPVRRPGHRGSPLSRDGAPASAGSFGTPR